MLRITLLATAMVAAVAAPATAVTATAVLNDNTLITYDPQSPSPSAAVAVTGVAAGETLVAIHSVDGKLYAIGRNGNAASLYSIDTTDTATLIGAQGGIAVSGSGIGISAIAGHGRLRLVDGGGDNLNINTHTGAAIAGPSLSRDGNPVQAVGITYSKTDGTYYVLDAANIALDTFDAATGKLTQVNFQLDTAALPNPGMIPTYGLLNKNDTAENFELYSSAPGTLGGFKVGTAGYNALLGAYLISHPNALAQVFGTADMKYHADLRVGTVRSSSVLGPVSAPAGFAIGPDDTAYAVWTGSSGNSTSYAITLGNGNPTPFGDVTGLTDVNSITFEGVPESATIALLGLGLGLVGFARRRAA